MQQRSHINQMKRLGRQQGATLITSLILLLVMTIVGVSSIKVSSIDTMIASNDMQQMMLHNVTENKITALSNTNGLYKAYDASSNFVENIRGHANKFKLTDSTDGASEIITNTKRRVSCYRFGKATSIGAVDCRVFDFQVKMRKDNSSAKDQRHRGVGKAVPATKCKGCL